MAKLISCAVFVLLAVTELANPAVAQVPGGGGEAVCQLIDHGLVSEQTGGTFPVGPANCHIGLIPPGEAGTSAVIAIQPSVLLAASADASFVEPADRSGAAALVALQYDFTLTGGTIGDLVPVLVHTTMNTFVDPSLDPNNANSASANINLFGVTSVGGRIVNNGPSEVACSFSPVDCGGSDFIDEDLELTMASGSAERVFLQILVAASSLSGGAASGQIDPFIFVDPHFPNAADYTITVASGVANALPVSGQPVPEPSVWALVLAGFGGLGIVRFRLRQRSGTA